MHSASHVSTETASQSVNASAAFPTDNSFPGALIWACLLLWCLCRSTSSWTQKWRSTTSGHTSCTASRRRTLRSPWWTMRMTSQTLCSSTEFQKTLSCPILLCKYPPLSHTTAMFFGGQEPQNEIILQVHLCSSHFRVAIDTPWSVTCGEQPQNANGSSTKDLFARCKEPIMFTKREKGGLGMILLYRKQPRLSWMKLERFLNYGHMPSDKHPGICVLFFPYIRYP